jgi:hypothetical protein
VLGFLLAKLVQNAHGCMQANVGIELHVMSDLETLPQPIAPGIDPERLQRLRDCWRPEIQQASALNAHDWGNVFDDERPSAGAATEAYNADMSLDSRSSTYVIPPAISRVIEASLEEADPKLVFRSSDTRQKGVERATSMFGNYFIFEKDACYRAYYQPCFHKMQTNVRTIRSPWNHEMREEEGTFTVDTKHVELNISESGSRYSDKDNGQLKEYRKLEVGLFGWVLPISEKDSTDAEPTVSLLKAGRFLVAASWDKHVPDMLNFRVKVPELSKAGHLLIESMIAENEHLLPNDVAYDDVLTYHQRAENPQHNRDWRFSRGDNAQGLAEHQAQMDEWLRKKPAPYRWR